MTIGGSVVLIGWRDPARSSGFDFATLAQRARRQSDELEAFRVDAAAEAFRR